MPDSVSALDPVFTCNNGNPSPGPAQFILGLNQARITCRVTYWFVTAVMSCYRNPGAGVSSSMGQRSFQENPCTLSLVRANGAQVLGRTRANYKVGLLCLRRPGHLRWQETGKRKQGWAGEDNLPVGCKTHTFLPSPPWLNEHEIPTPFPTSCPSGQTTQPRHTS